MEKHDDPTPVWVRWVDSANLFHDRWASPDRLDDCDDEVVCETLGWVVGENDHSVFVAGSIAPAEIGSVMQIPRAAIKEQWEIDRV
jgi:hypothetical protein